MNSEQTNRKMNCLFFWKKISRPISKFIRTEKNIKVFIPQNGMKRNPLSSAPKTAPKRSNPYMTPIFYGNCSILSMDMTIIAGNTMPIKNVGKIRYRKLIISLFTSSILTESPKRGKRKLKTEGTRS